MKKILVLSPHPDDETLGCGGTLLKYKKKKYFIDIIFFTRMQSKNYSKKKIIDRSLEIKKISKMYKFNKIFNFNCLTTKLDQISDSELIKFINGILKTTKPQIVFFPSPLDIHTDHYKVSRCFLSCVKIFRNKFLQKVYAYETLSETNFNFSEHFNANHFEDISKFIKKKIRLMKIFKSEISKHPFPRSEESIISLAKLRGSQANYNYAEAFNVYFSRNK